MAILYGHAGRLTTENGDSRPGRAVVNSVANVLSTATLDATLRITAAGAGAGLARHGRHCHCD